MRAIAFVVLFVAGVLGVLPAQAQEAYPSRPVTIVVAFAPGGVTDLVARLYAKKLGERLGQAFSVENRVGAGGTIGTDHVAHAKPDGYTLGMFLDSNTIAPALFAKLNSDPIKDFTPISTLAVGAHVVVAHPSFPPNNIAEMIAYAKQHPGMPYASSGLGTAQHLGMEMIKLQAGIQMTHVPYKGGGQAITDVVGGQVKVAVLGLAPALPFIKSGQLKALATTGEKRVPALPDVPTVSETLPGMTTLQWFGMVAPAGTPTAVIDKLHREILAISKQPDVVEQLQRMGLETHTSPKPDDFTRFMQHDLPKWPPLVKAAGIKQE